MTEYDPHRSVSGPLTEIRTVHSRAATALRKLRRCCRIETEPGTWVAGKYVPPKYGPHPQCDEMRAALEQVVELLAPWERKR